MASATALRLEIQGDWRQQHDTYDHGPAAISTAGPTCKPMAASSMRSTISISVCRCSRTWEWASATRRHRAAISCSTATTCSPAALQEFNFSNNSQGSIAAQGIVGAAYPFACLPGLSLTAEYRFMYVADSETFDGTFTNAFGSVPGQDQSSARSTITLPWSACATPSTCRFRRRRRRLPWLLRRPRSLPAPIWCSSTGIVTT